MLAGVVQPRRQVVEGVSPEAPSATSSASSLAALLLLQGASQPWGAKVTCEIMTSRCGSRNAQVRHKAQRTS